MLPFQKEKYCINELDPTMPFRSFKQRVLQFNTILLDLVIVPFRIPEVFITTIVFCVISDTSKVNCFIVFFSHSEHVWKNDPTNIFGIFVICGLSIVI